MVYTSNGGMMKSKVYLCATAMTFITLICGCSKQTNELEVEINEEDNVVTSEYQFDKNYDFSNAFLDGYVIYENNGDVLNNVKVNEFYQKTKKNEDSVLIIICYTKLGDPVVLKYIYKNGKYILYIDNTRDRNTEGEIKRKEIKDIEIIQNDKGYYVLIEKY